jgi:hypothetical protein
MKFSVSISMKTRVTFPDLLPVHKYVPTERKREINRLLASLERVQEEDGKCATFVAL